MRILELLLNTEEATASYESWCFEPEKEEKELGKLYLIGKLERADSYFLNDLASVIKKTYYSSPSNNLREAIKEANQKIKENGIQKGRLHFAILTIKNQELRFTKVGNIKIILLRKGGVLDIAHNLNQPRFFENIGSGSLKRKDKLLVLNKELFKEISKKRLISAALPLFKPKSIKKLLESKVSQSSGVCLVIISKFGLKLPKLRIPKLKIPSLPQLKKPKLRLPLKLPKIKKPSLKNFKKRKVILILLLVGLVGIGTFLFQREKEKKMTLLNQELNQIQEKVDQAESLLSLTKEKQAELLFEKAFKEIAPLTKEKLVQEKAIPLRKEIKDHLFSLNNLEQVKDPELIFEFDPKQIVPKKIVSYKGEIYSFSPYQENIYLAKGEEIKSSAKFKGATVLGDSILFFSEEKALVNYNEKRLTKFSLKGLYPDFNFTDISSFKSSFYLLDGKKGEILKGNLSQKSQELSSWLSNFSRKPREATSLGVNGSIWILKETTLERYYAGQYQETIKLKLFPNLEKPTELYTRAGVPYLYLLEPLHNRVIILNKEGELVKQFQSKKFQQLKDFAITNNGRKIYLLSGQKVYGISF